MTFNVAYAFFLVHTVLILLVLVLLLKTATELGLPQTMRDRWPLLLMMVLAMVLVGVLSGCGTAPSPVRTNPPVPAGLLTPPRPPVLLIPVSPSTTPGATTPSTPSSAPKTGSTTSV